VIFALLSVAFAVDQDSNTQLGPFLNRPFGLFYCRAQCVSSCLKDNLANYINTCLEERCSDFSENTPCLPDEIECWQTCGYNNEPTEVPSPLPVKLVRATEDIVNDEVDPNTILIEWEPQDGINVYIVEVLTMKDGLHTDNETILQTMTTSNNYLFERPSLCSAYMIRIITVAPRAVSVPHYKRINRNCESTDQSSQIDAPSPPPPVASSGYDAPEVARWPKPDATDLPLTTVPTEVPAIYYDGTLPPAPAFPSDSEEEDSQIGAPSAEDGTSTPPVESEEIESPVQDGTDFPNPGTEPMQAAINFDEIDEQNRPLLGEMQEFQPLEPTQENLPTPPAQAISKSNLAKADSLEFSQLLAGTLLLTILVSILLVAALIWYTNKRKHNRQEYLIDPA